MKTIIALLCLVLVSATVHASETDNRCYCDINTPSDPLKVYDVDAWAYIQKQVDNWSELLARTPVDAPDYSSIKHIYREWSDLAIAILDASIDCASEE